jgi:hypothetical protein
MGSLGISRGELIADLGLIYGGCRLLIGDLELLITGRQADCRK